MNKQAKILAVLAIVAGAMPQLIPLLIHDAATAANVLSIASVVGATITGLMKVRA